ncbi:MAG: tetrahydrofolate dehydrogenase/cyclohydrolase catalytic domain-containing protein, partial [bacterium]
MTTTIIDGKSIAAQIRSEVRLETERLKRERGVTPGLAFILVGENPASQVYVRSKGKACEEMGFHSVTEKRPDATSGKDLLSLIDAFNADS